MIITKEREYAVRAVRALSTGNTGITTRTAKDICNSENIPILFVYKILKKLEHRGIVQSVRGVHCGYRLAKEPNSISILDIFLAVDENLFFNKCLKSGVVCENHSDSKCCSMHEVFGNLQSVMLAILDEKTIDMLAQAQ